MQLNFRFGLAVASVAAIALSLGGTATALESSHGDLTVVEEAISDTEVPALTVSATPVPSADTAGAILVFANELRDKTDSRTVGSDRGDCTRINVAEGTWECRWTNFLPGGQITVEGPFNDTSDTVVSITGGTGIYAHARGQMLLQSVVANPADDKTGQDYNFVFQFGENGD